MLSLIILLFSMISTFPQSGTPTFVDSYLVKNSGETTPRYLAFNTDGTKMFIVGGTKDRLLEYTLTTGFDFSTLSYAGHSERFNLHSYDATGDSQPRGIAFNNDGTKMFVIGNSADEVNEYHLAIAFDISTASFDSRIDITATVGGAPNGLAFSADGTKMFITSNSSVNIFVFDLTTGFDVSTALFDNSESLSGYSGSSFRGITFNPIPKEIPQGIWTMCESSDEIIDLIQKYSSISDEQLQGYKELGKQVRESYFEPVTKESVHSFLELSS